MRPCALVLSVFLGTTTAGSLPALPPPTTVSPGEIERWAPSASICPTFSWAAIAGAIGYELRVVELQPGRSEDEASEVIARRIDGAATSWTPAGDECLTAGRFFAWFVRAFEEEADLANPTGWSVGRRFTVPAQPTADEVSRAFDTLRRYLETTEHRAMDTRTLGTPRVAAPRPVDRRSPTAAPAGTAAIRGEMPDLTGETYGVLGVAQSDSGRGVFGWASATSGSTRGIEGRAESSGGRGVFGEATASSGVAKGVEGVSWSSTGIGVYGTAISDWGNNFGVFGQAASPSGIALYGRNVSGSGAAYGAYGSTASTAGTGVYGTALSTLGAVVGVTGEVRSSSGKGVYGTNNASSGSAYGVHGDSASTEGIGVYGSVSSATGQNFGVYAQNVSTEGVGVYGLAFASTGSTAGVKGHANSTQGRGVFGQALATTGLTYGVFGESLSADGYGVRGDGGEIGVYAHNRTAGGHDVYLATKAVAGDFYGNVIVHGTIVPIAAEMRIDHPLAPEAQDLRHAFVASPERKTIYDGIVTLGDTGEAWVELPAWFESLNGEFRYQLTPLGSWSACWVAAEIADHRFLVHGGPGARISWQVTGVRRDTWAEAHPLLVEATKP